MASVTPSVRIVKSMSFKGGQRLWSNRYHFSGGTPATTANWNSLFDAVTGAEKTCYDNAATIVEALGYAAGSDVPVATKVYSVLGTLTPGANDHGTPGEVAALVRWSTDGRSTKNHPIYCFSYFHRALYRVDQGIGDVLASGQKAALQAYGNLWLTGFSDGTNTYKRSTPAGHHGVACVVEEYLTHRDFPPTTSV